MTDHAQGKSRMRRMLPGLAAMAMLLSGCSQQIASATDTERAICRELARDLPTYSRQDTAATLEAGARFVDVFRAVCPDVPL